MTTGWRTTAGPSTHPKNIRLHGVLARNTKAAKAGGKKYLREQIGTGKHPIHIEHGHMYDTDNADRDWSQSGNGFGVVFLGYADDLTSRLAMRSSHQDWALKTADDVSNFFDFEMRLYGLRRADELFKDKKIRLVIMGHTLIASPVRCELGPLYPGWNSYKQGKHWWKSDKELARERELALKAPILGHDEMTSRAATHLETSVESSMLSGLDRIRSPQKRKERKGFKIVEKSDSVSAPGLQRLRGRRAFYVAHSLGLYPLRPCGGERVPFRKDTLSLPPEGYGNG